MDKNVNDYIDKNEEIKFIATYNATNRTDNPDNTPNNGSFGIETDVAGICGFSFINKTYVYNNIPSVDNRRFVFENFSLSTINNLENNFSLGKCVWTGSYTQIDVSSGITTLPIIEFGVSASTGIYSGMIKVVIDYRNINRIIYLIGPKI